MNKTLLLLGMVAAAQLSTAQIVTNQQPRSFSRTEIASDAKTMSVTPPAMSKSASEGSANGPLCFGKIIQTDIDFIQNAVADSLDDATIFRLTVTSKGAYSIGLGFSDIVLQDGVEMYLYNADKSDILGAITSRNNKKSHNLRTEQIEGDSITVELYIPKGITQNSFRISKIVYDFKGVMGAKKTSLQKSSSESCEVDINCDYGSDYQDIKHAVVKYTYDDGVYEYMCTGTLVNNYKNDLTPYIITAAHCLCDQSTAEDAVFYFNYERTECGSTTKRTKQTLNGSDLVATAPQKTYGRFSSTLYPTMDFSLLKLNDIPPSDYQPYYAGFTNDTTNNLELVSLIHHPQGDYKKISISSTKPYEDSYPEEDEDCHYNSLCHWHVAKWKVGATEAGSSGSGLLNSKKMVIGMLSGGWADCNDPVDDYFQMISKAWECASDSSNQLKYWLAGDSAISEIPPYDPYKVCSNYRAAQVYGNVSSDTSSVTLSWGYAPEGLFDSGFEGIANTSAIEDVFLANVDIDGYSSSAADIDYEGKGSATAWVLLSGYDGEYQAHNGQNCAASFTASKMETNDYLTLPKLTVQLNTYLTFWAKSVGGTSSLKVSQNTKPSRYQAIDTIEVTEQWQRYSISLSEFAASTIYINFNNITEAGQSTALLIDDINVGNESYEYPDDKLSGYIVYMNDESTKISDTTVTTMTFPIEIGTTYNFYVVNVYESGAMSGISNVLTYYYKKSTTNDTKTPVADITPSTDTESTIYPNPTNDVLNIRPSQELGDAVIIVADMAGKIMLTKKTGTLPAGTPYELNVKALHSGAYILLILSDKQKIAKKFVVK